MKYAFVLLFLCRLCVCAQTSETFNHLNSAFDEDRPGISLDKVFNGAIRENSGLSFSHAVLPSLRPERSALISPHLSKVPTPALPTPVCTDIESTKKDFNEIAYGEHLTSGELANIRGGLELLKGTQFGNLQYWLYYKEGVELRWREMDAIAGSNPPSETVDGRKILWLNKDLKLILANQWSDPGVKAGLAVMMSHELTHFIDYARIGSCATEYCKFSLENNAHLAGVFSYHELQNKGLTPEIGSKYDTVFLEEQKLYLDIWNYKHGGPLPNINSYPLILKLKDLPEGNKQRRPYEQATKILSTVGLGKERFSLSEVVNVRYGYKETASGIAIIFHPSDTNRYETLFWAMYNSEHAYTTWRKSVGDPVLHPPQVLNPPQ